MSNVKRLDYTNTIIADLKNNTDTLKTEVEDIKTEVKNINGDNVKVSSVIEENKEVSVIKKCFDEIYFNNRIYDNPIRISKIYLTVNVTTTTEKNLTVYTINSDFTINEDTYSLTFTPLYIGNNTVEIDCDITLPAHCYLLIAGTSECSLTYANNQTGKEVYTLNNLTTGGKKGVLSNCYLNIGMKYGGVESLPNVLNNYALKTEIPTNYLEGKKIIAIGDSMVQGHSISKDSGWLAMIANRNKMTYINYGINGTFLTNRSFDGNEGVVVRYTSMVDDADYIIVYAGTNDISAAVTMGEDDSVDTTTFKGALNVLCDGLQTKYPTGKILFITPYNRNENCPAYIEAIETICNKHGIQVFNNMKNGGIGWGNAAQMTALTLGDNCHMSLKGHNFVSYKYEAIIRTL